MKINPYCVIHQEGFLFNSQTGESFSVNPIAMELLSVIKETECGRDKLAMFVSANYEVEDCVLQSDLDDFIFQLKMKGVVSDA